eukprot:TRINITY_DN66404_c0_g1_i2.p1 TRINITY_DN66404_c0_g1~~TRINITY_DN66404_c0_g1_i2.p1  ORF type:complete len:565 (-),score=53.81 TRINITY_DN66404_c0_g1_i2:714-2408(-)
MAARSQEPACQHVLTLWTRFWALHQLSPFVNAVLGISGGAIDNWPIHGPVAWWHWRLRLPLVLLAMAWPLPLVSFVANIGNLVFLAVTMPFVWDHMMWASMHEIAFVVAFAFGPLTLRPLDFLAAVQAQTVVSYCSAAFWKLTTSFLDPKFSCGTLLVAELLSILPEAIFYPGGGAAEVMLKAAPLLTVLGEFSIPLLLASFPHVGVLLGLGFHLTILMLPVNAAGGFSIACATSYFAFVSRGMVLVEKSIRSSMISAATVGASVAILFAVLRGTADATFAIYLTFAVLLVYAIVLEQRNPVLVPGSEGRWKLPLVMASCSACHGLLGPILGLQQMAALTMYANVQHWGGSNHLLVPVSLLQEFFADTSPGTSPLADAFAGGYVRVDHTDLPANVLRTPADASKLLPERVRQLLKGVDNAGLFYVPYYARMAANDFFDEVDSEDGMNWAATTPFAIPAFELRRLLKLARERGDPFSLAYTALPRQTRKPAEWLRHRGPQVVLREGHGAMNTSCAVSVEGSSGEHPCASGELALQPPPPAWLSAMLLQYPVPLLNTNDTELICIV